MNIVLTMRAEIVCLVILIFLWIYSSIYNKGNDERTFLRICGCSTLHVIFDIITVYTVNHLNEIPNWVNWICHVVFFMAAIMFCYEFLNYIIRVSYSKEMARKISIISAILPVGYLCSIPFLEITYMLGDGTNYSSGPCVYAGYGCTVLLFAASIAVLIRNRDKLAKNARRALFPMVMFMACGVVGQIIVPELLFTGIEITLVTVGMYFAVENPTEKYRSKAMMDIDTMVKNKNCFDEEIAMLGRQYASGVSVKELAIVVCDLNGLKTVNDTYGHMAGDELIKLAANALKDCLVSAYDIYRVGGDEFVAIYINENVVEAEWEVAQMKKQFVKYHTKEGYVLSMAVGMADGSDSDDASGIAMVADKRMYLNKQAMKAKKA